MLTKTRFETLAAAALVAAVAAVGFAHGVPAQETGAQPEMGEGKPYTVEDGVVDKATYNGYRRYHGSCHRCHGPDGLGSSYGPSLVESLKHMSYSEFVEITLVGNPKMPGFANDPNVWRYIDDMYAYLKARSDGVLGRGRPARKTKVLGTLGKEGP
jgi:mono/diheme cytochrome c family protein